MAGSLSLQKERNWSGADEVHEGRHPWIRACELASGDDQLNLGEQYGCLERVARVIQSDAMGDSASIDWPNLRAGDGSTERMP